MRSKQYFTSIKNNPHEISTDPNYLFQKNKISYKLQLKIKGIPKKHDKKNKAKIIYQIDIKSFAYYKRKAAPEA